MKWHWLSDFPATALHLEAPKQNPYHHMFISCCLHIRSPSTSHIHVTARLSSVSLLKTNHLTTGQAAETSPEGQIPRRPVPGHGQFRQHMISMDDLYVNIWMIHIWHEENRKGTWQTWQTWQWDISSLDGTPDTTVWFLRSVLDAHLHDGFGGIWRWQLCRHLPSQRWRFGPGIFHQFFTWLVFNPLQERKHELVRTVRITLQIKNKKNHIFEWPSPSLPTVFADEIHQFGPEIPAGWLTQTCSCSWRSNSPASHRARGGPPWNQRSEKGKTLRHGLLWENLPDIVVFICLYNQR